MFALEKDLLTYEYVRACKKNLAGQKNAILQKHQKETHHVPHMELGHEKEKR
jgi:hypothetical protein